MDTKYTFKEINTFQENNMWYMSMIVERETDREVTNIVIPKVKLVDVNDKLMIRTLYFFGKQDGMKVGFGQYDNLYECEEGELFYDDGISSPKKINAYYKETVIKEKTHELTIEEIEKKLGYKVKIVSKKKGDK